MAATNFTPIQLYHSSTASAAPSAGNLANGELAINITDGKLYYKDNAGVVQVIATKGAGTIGGSTTQIQYNNAGALAGNAAMTFNSGTSTTTLTTLNLTNALGATFGGTAQSTYTQGDILYSSASNTLSKLGIGTVDYILTSTGSVPQWSAPSSISVLTATNLAGGVGGSVPYQSAASTTTFLAIGAANRVMTSTGSAPQWVTSLTSLTGVSSSSITNTSLTSGRVVYSGASGVQTDSSNLTFNGTTLSAGGYSTTGLTTLVQTVTIGNSNFSGTAVFAPATPAKLYIGTGTVTDTTSAIGATNATGAVSSLAITPIAATNTSVTYTNAATLYIAGAPSAGTNVTLTNPYSLYIAAGAAYFGGGLTFAGQLNVTDTTDSSSTTTGSIVTAGGVGIAKKLFVGLDANIYGITVGRGAGAVSTNTAVGASALAANTTGSNQVAIGVNALNANTSGIQNIAIGTDALLSNQTGNYNTAVGVGSLRLNTAANNSAFGWVALNANTSGASNSAFGFGALQSNTTASFNTAVGYQAAYSNQTGAGIAAFGYQAAYATTGNNNAAFGNSAARNTTTGVENVAVGTNSLITNTTGSSNTALGTQALYANTTASNNTAVGYQAAFSTTTAGDNVAVGHTALRQNTTGSSNVAIGYAPLFGNTTGANNVAIGLQALVNNTTASNNTAVGYQALYSNTTAADITAVGWQAGYSATGLGSTYVGSYAGNTTTGISNTFVGHTAGYLVTTGTKNTIIGKFTGNQGGLDIRTASNYIVLSDGDGNPRIVVDGSSRTSVGGGVVGAAPLSVGSSGQPGGVGAIRVAPSYEAGKYFNALQLWPSDTTGRLDYSGMHLGAISSSNGLITSGSYYDFAGNHIPSDTAATMISMAGSTIGIYATSGLTVGTSFAPVQVAQFNSFGMGLANTAPTSGTGITFPATQSASSNANTLDDYEEGTWTPTLVDVTYTASSTYTAGRYTKIGRVVTVVGVITTDSLDTGDVSGVIVGGLPFIIENNNASYTPATLFVEEGFNASGVDGYMALAAPGTTNINFYTFTKQSSSDNYSALLYTQLTGGTNGTRVRFQLTYIV